MGQPWRYSVMVRGREVEVPEGEVTLGRSRSATVSVSDPSISRIHVRLVAREGRVMLEDLGSANGTYVNGLRISGIVELGDGAHLVLGESEMVLRVQKAPSPLATRRIDAREFLCARCGRPFPEGTRVCPQCAPADAGDVLPSIDLPPSPSTAPLRTQRPPKKAPPPPPRGLLSRLFGKN